MVFDFLPDIVTNNWGTVSTLGMTLLGGYAIKVKVAIGHVKTALRELEDFRDVAIEAVADNEVTADEAERIGKEVGEAIQAVHVALASVMSLVPERFRAKIPVTFAGTTTSKKNS
jgi:metal-sulfur cluster biosynthetic enzyme